jgi:hypothetical protein
MMKGCAGASCVRSIGAVGLGQAARRNSLDAPPCHARRWLSYPSAMASTRVSRAVARAQPAIFRAALAALVPLSLAGCTQEQQNRFKRDMQNWTGTNGVLEVYAGEKLVKRFIRVDKLSTAYGTTESEARPYRFGYGVLDENFSGTADQGERRVYFEISDYSTSYVFYESPR